MTDDVAPDELSDPNDIADLKIVITGRLEHHNRGEARDLVNGLGANVTKSISKQTDLVIVGENPGETKHEFAVEHDIPRLSSEEFYQLFGAWFLPTVLDVEEYL
jgi:DNA ligase (NAD+)